MLAIEARYYLGFYQGSTEHGQPERFPTPARLHAALAAGAHSLERLEATDTGLSEGCETLGNEEDVAVFDWLEAHAPDAISYPGSFLSRETARVYRNKGGIKDYGDAPKADCVASSISALDGSITWYWKDEPSAETFSRLEQIAHEVPYLGEAVCPVLLRAYRPDRIPSSALARCEPSFSACETAVALPGRWRELDEMFVASRAGRVKDKVTKSEEERSIDYLSGRIGSAYYSPQVGERGSSYAPWSTGFLLAIDDVIPAEERTMWATCLHRALVKQFGADLPAVMQRSRGNDRATANGLAIQFVDSSMPVDEKMAILRAAIAVLVPTGASAEDEDDIAQALSRITRLYSRESDRAIDVAFTGERIDLTHFWKPVPVGSKRLFETSPLFIPDSRPPKRRKSNGERWTVEDDARIAVGHAWRDLFSLESTGDAARVELDERVANAGVGVFGGRIVPTRNIRRYYHCANPSSFVLGARALIDLSPLGCDECLSAIGQSRHLGGGLLVPVDVPDSLFFDHSGKGGAADE